MNLKFFSKTAVAFSLAFFGAGGACYETPRTVSIEQMNAADVFTSYTIEEFTAENGKCKRRIAKDFFEDDRIFVLKPPARVTYNGAETSGDYECDGDKAEFVLTDAQGNKKTDVYGLKKIKADFPAQIDRAKNLRIPIGFDDSFDYDFSGTLKAANADETAFFRFFQVKDENDLADRLKNPDAPKDLAYFLRNEKILVVPQTIFAAFPKGEIELGIGVEQRFFKPKTKNPESSLKSQALVYKYSLDAKTQLK